MADPSANPIVSALATGKPEGYAALYDRMGRALLRVARAMLHQSGEAEDAVQDVFVELVRRQDQLAHVRDLDAYVFAILRNNIVQRLQRQRNELRHLQNVAPVHAEAQRGELKDADMTDGLDEALNALPAEQREVIALKVDGGLTFAQIADILRISPNTAASRYRYALEKLRRLLE